MHVYTEAAFFQSSVSHLSDGTDFSSFQPSTQAIHALSLFSGVLRTKTTLYWALSISKISLQRLKASCVDPHCCYAFSVDMASGALQLRN